MPAQTHTTLADPWREHEELDQTVRDVEAGGGTIEVFDYPGSGYLFTDPTLPAEYDPAATVLEPRPTCVASVMTIAWSGQRPATRASLVSQLACWPFQRVCRYRGLSFTGVRCTGLREG